MIKTIIACDVCRQELPIKDNTVMTHRTKEVDTKDIYPHLCEHCAAKIDEVVLLSRKQSSNKAKLIAKYAKINAERKKRLGVEE